MLMRRMHPGLAAYLAQHNAAHMIRHEHSLVRLVFDGQYRVSFIGASNGALCLESRICELPTDSSLRRSCLTLLLEQTGEQIEIHTAGLTLPQEGNLLGLQQFISAEAGLREFEQILEKFINLLASCRSLAGVL